ncbi:MAG TPA: DUF131 domain-containing protein [Nitrososphaerales archaeon]|nr:DUF131 domain-containing protein [Nitrososphaerales archaeon]
MSGLLFVGIAIILAGILVVVFAMMGGSQADESEGRTRVRGGGVIMVGPIPIVFGSDAKWASVAIVLAIILIVLVLLSGVLLAQ